MNETMSPRERIVLALNHQEPDRVPMDLGSSITGLTWGTFKALKEYLGIEAETEILVKPLQTVRVPNEFLEEFNIDTRYITPNPRSSTGKGDSTLPGEKYTDEWGITYKLSSNGYYYDMVKHPFEKGTLDEVENYDWPDPSDHHMFEGLRDEAKDLFENTNYAIVGDPLAPALIELAGYLRRLDRLLMDLVVNKTFAENLLRELLAYQKEFFDNFLKAVGDYIQVVMLGDDLGMQTKPMISPKTYREILKPKHAELFEFIKARTKAKIFLHSDGSISPLINDLVEAGVDILHPAQPLASNMGSEYLKSEFGDKVCFWGVIDQQRAMPGSKSDVHKEVIKRIRALAPGGGYVLAPGHNIQPDVPAENICELYKRGRKYGEYPINFEQVN